MATLHVFTPAEVLEAIDEGLQVVHIREKPNKSKKNYKVQYLDLIIKTKSHEGPAIFSLEDSVISYGLKDPAFADAEDDEGPRKLSISTTAADSGEFGKMMVALNPQFTAEVERCIEAKIFVKSKRTIKELISTHYSEDRTDEKAGQERESPIINFKIDFGTYPDNYPRKFMRGQQKSMIYDYTQTFTNKGATQYKLAKTDEGDSLNDANAFMFISSGSVIKFGRIHMESLAISQSWISVPTLAGKLVIDPAGDGGFDDEAEGFSECQAKPADENAENAENADESGDDENADDDESGDADDDESGESGDDDGEEGVDNFLDGV